MNTNTGFPLLASDKVLIQMTHRDLKVESNIWKEGGNSMVILKTCFLFLK